MAGSLMDHVTISNCGCSTTVMSSICGPFNFPRLLEEIYLHDSFAALPHHNTRAMVRLPSCWTTKSDCTDRVWTAYISRSADSPRLGRSFKLMPRLNLDLHLVSRWIQSLTIVIKKTLHTIQ